MIQVLCNTQETCRLDIAFVAFKGLNYVPRLEPSDLNLVSRMFWSKSHQQRIDAETKGAFADGGAVTGDLKGFFVLDLSGAFDRLDIPEEKHNIGRMAKAEASA
ncbi:hypothetical protein FOXYSP1_02544 [Fusarium oxysporum f. sp. phaseoli]